MSKNSSAVVVGAMLFAFTVVQSPSGNLPAAVALVASTLAFGQAANAILRQ